MNTIPIPLKITLQDRQDVCHLGLEIMAVWKQNKCPHKIEIVTSMIGPKLILLTMS